MRKNMLAIVLLLSLPGLAQKKKPVRTPQQVIGQIGKIGGNEVLRCAGLNTTDGKTDLIDTDYLFSESAGKDQLVAGEEKLLDNGKYRLSISASKSEFQGVVLRHVSIEVENVSAGMSAVSLDTTHSKLEIIKKKTAPFDNNLSIACSIVPKT